jgi:cell surface protein SprA
LEQKVNERSREDYAQFDISANIDAGKLLPRNFGMQIPIYAALVITVLHLNSILMTWIYDSRIN